MKKPILILVLLLVAAGIFYFYQTGDEPMNEHTREREGKEMYGEYGVSASHPLATQIGLDVLEAGGNAVDAAVAISYALSVVEPYGSGLGGGGEMLVYEDGNTPFVQQYRETAPNSFETQQSLTGVPGFAKGMEDIHRAEGSLPMRNLLDQIIPLAEKGFTVDKYLEKRLNAAINSGRVKRGEAGPFFINGEPIQEGDLLVQKELAATLKVIRDGGADELYNGQLGEAVAKQTSAFHADDLENYESKHADAVQGRFMGYDVYSATPPLSGITVIQSLQMAEAIEGDIRQADEPDFVKLVGELSKTAYEQRLYHIADSDYAQISTEEQTNRAYTDQLLENRKEAIFKSNRTNDTEAEEQDYSHTTHFVVVDASGMMVSTTNTIGNFFGTGEYVEEGFFLNNALTNFSKSESSPNLYEPGKRPRSFMAPTILANEDEVIGIGSPGGRRIPAVLSQTLIRHVMLGESLQDAVDAPRFYMEDEELQMEASFSTGTYQELAQLGYDVEINTFAMYFGGIQALSYNKADRELDGASDSRRNGEWKKQSK
ncbi:gamma-glutamyltransferase family protein [Shouchella patagoniensis]|uniref:gamma-glutamyltransferase family protein n=1 Tax=Shouchella patagoniensis TaxID=228576 RepID=UPI000995600B|nr:gamma-glutamyltransferase [Shouchella patagoniensis]